MDGQDGQDFGGDGGLDSGFRRNDGWGDETARKFTGPVEADETCIGCSGKNKRESQKLKSGRGTVVKRPIVGVKDRQTNQVRTEVVDSTNKAILQGFVVRNTEEDVTVYTDERGGYKGIPRKHEAVAHGAGEYVRK